MATPKAWHREAADLPATPGAYAVLIQLDRAADIAPRWSTEVLPAGRYCYLGSARGPGGIRARCRRHLAGAPSRHWHIDWLTSQAKQIDVLPLPDRHECDLVSALVARPGVSVPLARFGSSDCQRCSAHLLSVQEITPGSLTRWLTSNRTS
ncbi:MAG: GIY-YIG nuclease family protein [Pseudomonadota bacterium]